MLSISTTLSSVISYAGLFLLASCGTLGRRSDAEPRLKITAIDQTISRLYI